MDGMLPYVVMGLFVVFALWVRSRAKAAAASGAPAPGVGTVYADASKVVADLKGGSPELIPDLTKAGGDVLLTLIHDRAIAAAKLEAAQEAFRNMTLTAKADIDKLLRSTAGVPDTAPTQAQAAQGQPAQS